jgi:hypothetical protein
LVHFARLIKATLMSRPLIYNGFLHLTPNHHAHGYWRTPEGQVQYGYSKLEPYVDVVKTLERGRLDTLFIADVSGVYDFEHTIRAGSQFPSADPITILSALGLLSPATSSRHIHLPSPVSYRLLTITRMVVLAGTLSPAI